MQKEEILEKSRKERNNELEEHIRDKAMKWTYIALVLSAGVFAYIRGIYGQPIMDLCATVCISVFAGRIYCFAKTKDQHNLIIAAITLIIALVATVRFFMGH